MTPLRTRADEITAKICPTVRPGPPTVRGGVTHGREDDQNFFQTQPVLDLKFARQTDDQN